MLEERKTNKHKKIKVKKGLNQAIQPFFVLCFLSRNDDVHGDDDDHKNDCYDGGRLGKDLIHCGALALAEEGLGAARNAAGQTLVLAGLHQNSDYQKYGHNQKQNSKNDFNRSHFYSISSKKDVLRRSAIISQFLHCTTSQTKNQGVLKNFL